MNNIENKRQLFEKDKIKYVEFSTIKDDGNKYHIIMTQEAYKKLNRSKLKLLKNIMR